MLAPVFIMSCSNEITVGSIECGNIQIPNYNYTFRDGKCYQNGQLLGNVVFSDEKIIQVEQSNGGLADGTIRTFVRVS
jgi:hypothetical protein